MLYATTSRKPSVYTKRLCRLLCSLLPGSVYENRGKKSVDEVVARTRSLGCPRILIFSEEHGNPRGIRAIKTNGEWAWDTREIIIGSLILGEKTKTPRGSICVSGPNSKLFSEIFQIGDSGEDGPDSDSILLHAGPKKISFEYSKKLLLSFDFEVVEHGQAEM
ncbi:MAG: hypothetical protein NT157_02775 [Candidatus Micrarchaeota archaeon]|nr:hypothetical protein [Candidatus Micrarchaeota archaeon]